MRRNLGILRSILLGTLVLGSTHGMPGLSFPGLAMAQQNQGLRSPAGGYNTRPATAQPGGAQPGGAQSGAAQPGGAQSGQYSAGGRPAQPAAGYSQQQQQQQPQQTQAQAYGQPGAGQAGANPTNAVNMQAGQYQPNAQPNAQTGQAAQSQPVQLTPEQAEAARAAQQAALAEGMVNPVPPFEPLKPEYQDYLDRVLAKWEEESSKVNRYECEFLRYQFDPSLVTQHAYTVAAGTVKYMKPDKGLFKVNEIVYYKTEDENKQPKYEVNAQKQFGEYWICDGQYVHVLDQNEKKCTKYQLPPHMRGQAIHMSPLPFVFGVKATELKARYWLRPLNPPADRKNEVWLEVYPRRADDAANYQRLQVVIDLQDWMPKGLIVFLPNYRPEAPHRELYEFKKRSINAANLMSALFQREFIPQDPPKDWKVIVEPYQPAEAEAKPAEPRVANPPGNNPPLR